MSVLLVLRRLNAGQINESCVWTQRALTDHSCASCVSSVPKSADLWSVEVTRNITCTLRALFPPTYFSGEEMMVNEFLPTADCEWTVVKRSAVASFSPPALQCAVLQNWRLEDEEHAGVRRSCIQSEGISTRRFDGISFSYPVKPISVPVEQSFVPFEQKLLMSQRSTLAWLARSG